MKGSNSSITKGKVYLVGAGPGDPDLITIKGMDCLSDADVVIYDNLANKSLLRFAPDGAEIIYAGKRAGVHIIPQEDINNLIIGKAREGLRVVRLKGGDPFIFGRGGEEAEALSKEGINFEVIPGVSSAIAVPGCAGIPLTHRDITSTVAIITGHESAEKKESRIPWESISKGIGTLVFLMGVGNLASIARKLIEHGRSEDTPAAVIQNGSLPVQKTVTGTLRNISKIADQAAIEPPAIIIVGDVTELREKLNWFESRPLFGKRILITRARKQASKFSRIMNRLGADCIEFPTIEIVPPPQWGQLDRAIRRIDKYQWIIFTSINGVRYFFSRLNHYGYDSRILNGIKIAAIGMKTANALKQNGIIPDLVPDRFMAEDVYTKLIETGIKGKDILMPRALNARDFLPVELAKLGAFVDEVPAYETVKPVIPDEIFDEINRAGRIDLITFTSSSTVKNFLSLFDRRKALLMSILRGAKIACIGPVTAESAKDLGLNVHIIPDEYTIEGLVSAIVKNISISY